MWYRNQSEIFEQIEIPSTKSNIIRYQIDCVDLDALIEFKLTTNKNHQKVLRKALVQIFLYDFLLRIKYNINTYHAIIVEILNLNENKIYRYGGLGLGRNKEAISVGVKMGISKKYLKKIIKEIKESKK